MAWFRSVPDSVSVTQRSLLLAGEAIEITDGSVDHDPPNAERPPVDWAAAAVLQLTRLQLKQMIEILSYVLGEDVSDWEQAQLTERILSKFSEAGLDASQLEYDISVFGEAFELYRALEGDLRVSHAFQVDGSITLTIGPEIPKLPALGIRGSNQGEMEDEPSSLFDKAWTCTGEAANLSAILKGYRGAAEPLA